MNQSVYFEAIRYRRWHELEEYAKWSPNQVLADTVSALAQTIGDKQDEKKLKKILFLLAQKGIRPFEGEKRAKKVPARQSLVGFACMGSPDRFGFCQFLVGVQNGRMGEAICFYANPFLHYCRVVEVHTVPFAQLRMIKHNFLTRCQAPIVSVVSLDFVRGRLACCIDRHYPDVHKGVPYEVPKFWKSVFEGVSWASHPARDFEMPKVSNARTLELCHEIPELAAFRVVPKANSPLTDELFPLTWSTLESPEARVAGVLRVIRSHPEDFWNDYVAADMHLRLFDLAYLYDLRGDSRGKELARVAEDVYHKRANSAFGQWFEELIANDIDSIIGTDEEGYAAA